MKNVIITAAFLLTFNVSQQISIASTKPITTAMSPIVMQGEKPGPCCPPDGRGRDGK